MSSHVLWDRSQAFFFPASALATDTHFPTWEMLIPACSAACSQWVRSVVKTLLGLKGVNFITTHSK